MDARLEQFLSAKQARYERLTHPGVVTAQERAAVSHTSGWSMAKVIVVKERDAFVMAVVPACCALDLHRLAGLIGHGEVRLATVEEIGRLVPWCMPGAIPPFGAVFGLRTFVDRGLLRAPRVTMPAGDAASAIRMSSAEFRRVVDGTVGDFAVAEALLQTGGVVRRRRRAG